MVIHSTMSNRKKVDSDLQQFEIGNRKYYKYILFSYLSADIRLAGLYVSNINNIDMKYEIIYKVDINNNIPYNGQVGTL